MNTNRLFYLFFFIFNIFFGFFIIVLNITNFLLIFGDTVQYSTVKCELVYNVNHRKITKKNLSTGEPNYVNQAYA